MLEKLFHLRERGTTVATELRGGAITFATMCYIVFVQPAVLSQGAGMDFGAVLTATCLSAALATLVMGLWANYPIAEAPLMGENFFFAFSVVGLMGVPWPTALGIVFLSGLAFLALTLLRVRQMILDAVPASLRAGIAAGIGLFIAFIGLTHAGIVVKSPAPGAYVQIGDLASPIALVALCGLAVTAVLFARGVRGGILIGLAATTILAVAAGLVRPSGVVAWPPSLAPTFLRMDLAGPEARRPDPCLPDHAGVRHRGHAHRRLRAGGADGGRPAATRGPRDAGGRGGDAGGRGAGHVDRVQLHRECFRRR